MSWVPPPPLLLMTYSSTSTGTTNNNMLLSEDTFSHIPSHLIYVHPSVHSPFCLSVCLFSHHFWGCSHHPCRSHHLLLHLHQHQSIHYKNKTFEIENKTVTICLDVEKKSLAIYLSFVN